jgi:hypothetical protein
VGGGVDIALSHRFALRIQPDYLKTEILGRKQNNFRASAGMVLVRTITPGNSAHLLTSG